MPHSVLVVEDDERLAASVRRALEYQQLRVSVAHDGPAALVMAARDRAGPCDLGRDAARAGRLGVCRALRATLGDSQPMVRVPRRRPAAISTSTPAAGNGRPF